MARVALITVTYHSDHVVDRYVDGLERLRRDSDHDLQVIVVDNASSDGTVARLRARGVDPWVAEDNVGWSAGNNLGFQRCDDGTDHVVFLNPDVILPAEALDALIAAVDAPGAGAAVPWLRSGEVLRFPAQPDYSLADAFLGAFGLRRLRGKRLMKRVTREGTTVLRRAYPEGACVLFPHPILRELMPLNEDYFVFFDDVDLSRRLLQRGHHAVLAAALAEELPEKGSKASPGDSQDGEKLARYRLYLDGELRYYRAWYGNTISRWIARWRRQVDLRLLDRRWRRRFGIDGLRESALPVVQAFLDGQTRPPRGQA